MCIVWFRTDLRLDDHLALREACRVPGSILPVYIWDPRAKRPNAFGETARWWLAESLCALDASLRERGSRLLCYEGKPQEVIPGLVRAQKVERVLWSRGYDPETCDTDVRVTAACCEAGAEAQAFGGALLHEPETIHTRSGDPFQVFTPFWKACLANEEPPAPHPAPGRIPAPKRWPNTLDARALADAIRPAWRPWNIQWTPGSAGAAAQLDAFLRDAFVDYPDGRDIPSVDGTSRLSPHLRFGEISSATVWHAVREQAARCGKQGAVKAEEAYLRQLGWREFAYHLLAHFPHTISKPLRSEFAAFPWRDDRAAVRAWQEGRTGYPLVDAGMRQLAATGWMHNRVRMIAASFLTKHLLVPWQTGARWFWDRLVDADLANNTLGWQWTAGCGADAAPYFRILGPSRQGERFDPDGNYVRTWVPELDRVPDRWIHEPWRAPKDVLTEAGAVLGRDYPLPMVDHAEARERALAAYDHCRKAAR